MHKIILKADVKRKTIVINSFPMSRSRFTGDLDRGSSQERLEPHSGWRQVQGHLQAA